MEKKRKLSFILAAILIVLVGFFLLIEPPGEKQKTILIKALEAETVTRLSIETPDAGEQKSIELYREGTEFKLGKNLHTTDEAKVKELFDIASGEIELELISSSGGLARYGLSEDEILHVRLYDKAGKIIRQFSLGGSAHRIQSRFVLLDDDKENVYQSYTKFSGLFHVQQDELRDKNILSFNSDELVSLDLSNAEQSLFLRKQDQQQQPKENNEDNTGEAEDSTAAGEPFSWVDNKKNNTYKTVQVGDIINTLSFLKVNAFYYPEIDEISESMLREKLVMRIEAETSSKEKYSLYMYAEDAKTRYPASLSEDGEIFFLPRTAYDRLTSFPDTISK